MTATVALELAGLRAAFGFGVAGNFAGHLEQAGEAGDFVSVQAEAQAYGLDSPLPGYTYYGTQLLDWIVDRLARQTGAPDTPLEDVGALLGAAGRPPTALIGIGATRYTRLGATTFLQAGDDAVVVVYDGARHTPAQVHDAIRAGDDAALTAASVLRQTVYDAG